ncbi:MAG: AMP-binding protein [Bacteroidaceae bacterium]|nr:AMP-binding protein [Bacteroidaceae bacterium]
MSSNVFKNVLDVSSIINLNNPSTIAFFQESITKNWNLKALSDYQGETYLYKDIAEKIERAHILYRSIGLKPGDKAALCGKNCANWAIAFLSILSYGAVPVPILADFKSDYIHNIVNHSEARLLYVGESQWKSIDTDKMPAIEGYFNISGLELIQSQNRKLTDTYGKLDEIFSQRFPNGFGKNDVAFFKEKDRNDLAILNYTSGTTSFPKGVMIPYRALRMLLIYSLNKMPLKPGSDTVCMLPLAHMFGLMFEFIYDFTLGCHIHFLTKIPSPKIIFQTFREFKPTLIITVPLVIEKVVNNGLMPIMDKPSMKIALRIPILRQIILRGIRNKLIDIFGGKMVELIIGGAALSKEVENCLRTINFPYSVGYGATECAPLISYTHWNTFKPGTCGQPIDGVTVEIHSSDPENTPGEITIKGDNVMLGYYKNPEATAQAIDDDGWFYTGDMGLMDKHGFITIKGRSKNMILGSSGQNIYPEEIETIINKLPLVAESLVVERDGKLIGLIVADPEAARTGSLSRQQIEQRLDASRKEMNESLPAYERVHSFQLMEESFEKTPKGSIKRFLYQ